MAGITFESTGKSFRDVKVIKSLDLSIRDGEFFTFVGPSGCGKSTLLNLIAGLEEPSTGRILFDGKDVTGLSPGNRDIAMVFQSYALYPHMNVYQNLAFPLRMKGKDRQTINDDVLRTAAFLGLEELLGRKPAQLSGGQRQRVALGRAIIRRPKVFLMDEPLSNLDARLRVEMRAEIKRLHRELGITTVYVTHDQAEAMGLSDRIAVIETGAIMQCAEPMEVYLKPANTFVAGFIGSPPINLMDADVLSIAPFRISLRGATFSPFGQEAAESGAEKVKVGIRPEDLAVSMQETPLKGEVEFVETEGPVSWVNLQWQGLSLKGRLDEPSGAPPARGEDLFLHVPEEKLHVFDTLTGQRLKPRSTGPGRN